MTKIRNIAIIAHVDHGKTTLIDTFLSQSGFYAAHQQQQERVMDSNDLEKERGITILAKCTAINFADTKINIIDTPGHADFSGEVERVLSMAEGVLLLVDAAEGPMPQTKFVTSKALELGLKPIVIINKADRSDARCEEVLDEIFDLFVSLDADEEQLDFMTFYGSGRDGWCSDEEDGKRADFKPVLQHIIDHVPAPNLDENAKFAMLATILEGDAFLGRILTGKVLSGTAQINQNIKAINKDNPNVEQGRLTKLFTFNGTDRITVDSVVAGDIVSVAGTKVASVADTICDVEFNEPLKAPPIAPPTMSITIGVNTSPLAGRDGNKLTSTMIRDRLLTEAERNIAIKLEESANKESFTVSGRGELQLGVLIETMRREGFELTVSRPQVVIRDGNQEPIEEVIIDVDEEYSGSVIDKLTQRKGSLVEMKPSGGGKVRITMHSPSRGLIGYQSIFLTDTRGSGIMNRLFLEYQDYKGDIPQHRNGTLISTDSGKAVAYALFNLQDRGKMFIDPQDDVYQGMIVGENSRGNDLDINVLKGKKLTNVRASGTDDAVTLTPPIKMTLEEMISYIQDDELVEVTPNFLRLRKKFLLPHERKKAKR
jgi:GTP-binding protein